MKEDTNEIRDAYLLLQEASGIRVGDKVRVMRKAKSYSIGWNCCWCNSMDIRVGTTVTVESIDPMGIVCRYEDGSGCAYFPWFVLEPTDRTIPVVLNPGYTAVATKEGVDVGGRKFTLEAMDRLAAAVAEVRK